MLTGRIKSVPTHKYKLDGSQNWSHFSVRARTGKFHLGSNENVRLPNLFVLTLQFLILNWGVDLVFS